MELDKDLSSSGSTGNNGDKQRYSQPTWHVWGAAYTLAFICINSQLLFSFFPAENISSPSLVFILANFLSFHITGLVTIAVMIHLFVPPGQRAKEAGLNNGFSMALVIKAMKITIWIVPAVCVLNLGILTLLEKLDWSSSEDPMMNWLQTAPTYTLLLLIFGAVIIAPIAEEFMFRLVLHNTFRQFFGKSFANLSTSLIFAVFHFKPEQILPLFLLALILQRSFNRSQNILPSNIDSFTFQRDYDHSGFRARPKIKWHFQFVIVSHYFSRSVLGQILFC